MAQDNPNYPIGTAAISWVDGGGTAHIRVYSTDGYKIIERCWDGSAWTTSAFAEAGGDVSATVWQNGGTVAIRVYATFQDKTVEYCGDGNGNWYQGGYTTQ